MKTVQLIKTVLTAVLLVWIVSGCSSKEIRQETIETQSGKEVSYKAPMEATSYRWRQLSGIEVHIDDPNSRILRFSAPKVSKEERLGFELEAVHNERNIERMLLSVIVSASPSDTDTAGGDDGNATEGETNDHAPLSNDNDTTAGNAGDTTIGGSENDNTTTAPTPTLKSLNLTVNKTSLNKDENTTVKVMATYSDNTTKEVTDKVEWVVVPNNAIKVTDTTLTALQDKTTTLRAKLNGKTSNAIDLNITWVVNGHTLPPEPDKALNDATLLGVDVNNNGVRDDVERWIYDRYKDSHPIERGILMQGARANTSLLSTKPAHHQPNKNIKNVTSCQFYWIYERKPSPFNKYELYEHDDEVDKLQFNTVKRLVAKRKYEMSLSGGVYPLIKADKSKCEFDENGNLKAQP